MELYDAIKLRKTVRDFSGQPVEEDKIKRILEAGLMAPTHDHLRNWEFVVITDKVILNALLKYVPRVEGNSQTSNMQSRSIDGLMYDYAMPRQYSMLYGAACVILPFFKQRASMYQPEAVSGLNAFASIWCCIENIFLAATAEGLACSMRIPTGKEPSHIQRVIQHPDDYLLPCYIGLGYPKSDALHPAQMSCDLNKKLHYNKW